ncbi:MAG: cell division protein FtsZ [Paramuribaculum sp.]|nr:cell division protein FtsZ [Paramuribaculum sp.]
MDEENNIYSDLGADDLAEKFDSQLANDERGKIVIKAIGVGGGGSNAVNHMYKQDIAQLQCIVLNTDRQALLTSPVPNKVLIGSGRGAGGVPEKARLAAEDDINKIRALLTDDTCMVFITAGMGGGTGTGAAPVVAQAAREKDILTIGIVTIPFFFEGDKKIEMAMQGADEMRKYVDSLLIINNERLTEIYGGLSFINGFAKSDETLSMAARSISELITGEGYINLDFEDVNTTLRNGGAAIISTGYGEGEDRVTKAIKDALYSPLLRNRDIMGAKRLLFNLYFSRDAKQEFVMSEMQEFTDFVQGIDNGVEVIWGVKFDETLGDQVKVTILAAGFEVTIREEEDELRRQAQPKARPKKTTDSPMVSTIRDRISQEYGASVEKYRTNYIILTPDEMDNDMIIDVLEKIPAYNREKKIIEDIRRATAAAAGRRDTVVRKPGEGTSITFGEE